jgi:hypothetical protein
MRRFSAHAELLATRIGEKPNLMMRLMLEHARRQTSATVTVEAGHDH